MDHVSTGGLGSQGLLLGLGGGLPRLVPGRHLAAHHLYRLCENLFEMDQVKIGLAL